MWFRSFIKIYYKIMIIQILYKINQEKKYSQHLDL